MSYVPVGMILSYVPKEKLYYIKIGIRDLSIPINVGEKRVYDYIRKNEGKILDEDKQILQNLIKKFLIVEWAENPSDPSYENLHNFRPVRIGHPGTLSKDNNGKLVAVINKDLFYTEGQRIHEDTYYVWLWGDPNATIHDVVSNIRRCRTDLSVTDILVHAKKLINLGLWQLLLYQPTKGKEGNK